VHCPKCHSVFCWGAKAENSYVWISCGDCKQTTKVYMMSDPWILFEYLRIKCDEKEFHGVADWAFGWLKNHRAIHPDIAFTLLELLELSESNDCVKFILKVLSVAIGCLEMDFGEASASESWVVGVILRYVLQLISYPEKEWWQAAYEVGLEDYYWKRLRGLG